MDVPQCDPVLANLLGKIWAEQDGIKARKVALDEACAQFMADLTAMRSAYTDAMIACYKRLAEMERLIRESHPNGALPERKKTGS